MIGISIRCRTLLLSGVLAVLLAWQVATVEAQQCMCKDVEWAVHKNWLYIMVYSAMLGLNIDSTAMFLYVCHCQ